MANKERIYSLAKIYAVYIAISTVIFVAEVYLSDTPIYSVLEMLTVSGFANVASMIIITVHTALYATVGSNFGMIVLNLLSVLMAAGSLLGVLMVICKNKYGYFLLSFIILISDVVCHVLVGGIVFPAAVGLIFKIMGIYILAKAYKTYKNEQKERQNDIT